VLSRSALGLVSQVIVQPHLVDLIEMGFEPVDVGFLLEQDQFEEFTGPIITDFDRQANVILVYLNGDIVKCFGSAFIVRVPGGHIEPALQAIHPENRGRAQGRGFWRADAD